MNTKGNQWHIFQTLLNAPSTPRMPSTLTSTFYVYYAQYVQLINPYLHVENNYQTYNIPKLHQMIWLGNVKLWHQCSLGTLPKNLAQSMTSDHNEKSLIASHKYLTRSRKVPRLPHIQNKLYCDSFLFKGLSDYMKLNAEMRKIKKILCVCIYGKRISFNRRPIRSLITCRNKTPVGRLLDVYMFSMYKFVNVF